MKLLKELNAIGGVWEFKENNMPKFNWDEVVYIKKRTSKTWFNDIARVESSAQDKDGNWVYELNDIKYNEPIEEVFAENELEEYTGQNAFNDSDLNWNGTEWA